jgi:hypothetical protein
MERPNLTSLKSIAFLDRFTLQQLLFFFYTLVSCLSYNLKIDCVYTKGIKRDNGNIEGDKHIKVLGPTGK